MSRIAIRVASFCASSRRGGAIRHRSGRAPRHLGAQLAAVDQPARLWIAAYDRGGENFVQKVARTLLLGMVPQPRRPRRSFQLLQLPYPWRLAPGCSPAATATVTAPFRAPRRPRPRRPLAPPRRRPPRRRAPARLPAPRPSTRARTAAAIPSSSSSATPSAPASSGSSSSELERGAVAAERQRGQRIEQRADPQRAGFVLVVRRFADRAQRVGTPDSTEKKQ